MIVRKKVYLIEMGCPARALESLKIKNFFQMNDHEIVSKPEGADYIIFSTCALENDLKTACYHAIDKLMRYSAKLIVTGCFPAVADVKLYDNKKVRFIPVKHMDKLDDIFKDFKVKFESLPDNNLVEVSARKDADGKQRRAIAILRVGVGCNEFCTYCITRLAVGKLKSKPLDVCLSEYKECLRKGYRSFKLLGEDVGAYGVDCNSSLLELLERMSDVDRQCLKRPNDKVKLMIENFNPYWAVKYRDALKVILRTGKVISLTCPIQSGSDRILRLMGRRYRIKEVEESLLAFRGVDPALRLFTHIIVGFSTETHHEFIDSLEVIKRVSFTGVEVLSYSDNKETPAYKLSGKIDAAVISKRKGCAESFLAHYGFKYNNNTERVVALQHLVGKISG
ncbi:MAG: radical SAM protein [Candidatus Omnitrophota bacterium]